MPDVRSQRGDAREARRRGVASRRGTTLVEAAFAALILCIGVLAIFGLMHRVDATNRSVNFQRMSLDVLARVSAEIRDARCDARSDATVVEATMTDPGIMAALNAGGGWIRTPVPESAIATVGNLNGVPPLEVTYRAAPEATAGRPPALDFDVRIREVMREPGMNDDAYENTYWVQTFPVKKLCNARVDTTARGEY